VEAEDHQLPRADHHTQEADSAMTTRRDILKQTLALAGVPVVGRAVKPVDPWLKWEQMWRDGEIVCGFDPAFIHGSYSVLTRGIWKDGVLHITSQEKL
jgi:hypothetical protein